MNISKVTVSMGQKINLRNYETRDIQLSLDVDLAEGDDPTAIINGTRKYLGKHLGDYYKAISALRLRDEGIVGEALAEQESQAPSDLPF